MFFFQSLSYHGNANQDYQIRCILNHGYPARINRLTVNIRCIQTIM